jgi:carbonic anhydrase/acetyltransferase-like protein (isoleucine patch superfamily)
LYKNGKQIGDQAVIGMGAVISIWSEIGEWAIVAEGSVVKLKQIIPLKIVAAGNPAKIIRDVSEKVKEFRNWGKKIYIYLAKKYLDIGVMPLDNRQHLTS